MANYQFDFQQYDEGRREVVRPSPAHLVSPYAAASFYEPGFLHRTVRLSQARHIAQSLQRAVVDAPTPRPRRRRQRSRSLSTTPCCSRSRRRTRTRRSRTPISKSRRRRQRSRSPSRASSAVYLRSPSYQLWFPPRRQVLLLAMYLRLLCLPKPHLKLYQLRNHCFTHDHKSSWL